MKKAKGAKQSSRSKQPMSPAIAEVLSNMVTQEESDDESDQQRKQPFASTDGNGATNGSTGGGSTSGVPSTPAPVMVMDQDGVAAFTSNILAALGASGGSGSPSGFTGSNVGTGLVQPIGVTNLVQFEAGKSQASSLRRHNDSDFVCNASVAQKVVCN